MDSVCDFSTYHNAFSDLCFCTMCEPRRMMMRSDELYGLPQGWFGFGIHIRPDFQARRSEIEGWPVAYHGTTWHCLESIMLERRIMFPGDTLPDGTVLKVQHHNCGAKLLRKEGETDPPPVIYVSPSINYASCPVYATQFSACGKTVQAAFQCRVKPGSFIRYNQTLSGHRPASGWDPEFPDDTIEWIVRDKDAVVPYRVLLRWF